MPRKTKSAGLLELNLLGSFRLARNGQLVQLPTRKAESLLAYLVLHPESHTREKLASLFWGDSSDLQARTSLRTALAVLHKQLGDESIFADHDSAQINLDCFAQVDALDFGHALDPQAAQSRHAELTNVEQAIQVYQGDLLADHYDEWILAERERYRSQYVDALLWLTQKMRERGEYPRAIEFAHQLLETDPANEPAHQHLMFCYLATGKRLEALKQYDECKRLLMEYLAIEPSPETIKLYSSIQRAENAPKAHEAVMTNLPSPVTSFIGREEELAELKHVFANTRLLTLTGAGGIGKTRLAKVLAFDLVNDYRDGVWFVEFVELKDAALVPRTVAKTLGVRETSDQPIDEALVNALTPRHVLLVLDNCEHLVEACARLCEQLLYACPNLKILVTSREILGIPGETIWRVPPLKFPETKARIDHAATLLQFDAVRLFNERAMAASPTFQVNDQNVAAIMQICQRLDGIPLALELAAARTRGLSVEQIANKLDDRFRLLTGGSRTALPRYQTLRALIDWSYELLSDHERALFRRLSVFVDGWTLEEAEAICGESYSLADTLDLLAHLVDKSLVLADTENRTLRYRFLETIRQYARDKLLSSDEATRVRNRHRDWFLRLGEDAEPHLRSSDQAQWLRRLEQEHENLKSALEWSLSREAVADDVEKGLRLAGALTQFWAMHGHMSDGRTWLERARACRSNLRRFGLGQG
ncbi:MAG: hypothetical protein HZB51_03850 [Chloroflexi bacterium]|nr:hypothetical protein [Chloroflexota bacterium]